MIEHDGLDVVDSGNADRRRRRWPWVAAICIGVLVAAAVVTVPRVRSAYVASNLRWLRDAWASAESYDDARTQALSKVASRIVTGDEPVLGEAITAVDREQSMAVRTIAVRIAHHHTGAADVTKLRDRMVAALRAHAEELTADAAAPDARVGVAPTVTGEWLKQSSDVDRLLSTVLATHKVSASPHITALSFHGADAAVTRLSAITDLPMTGMLLISTSDRTNLLDLPSGQLRRHVTEIPAGTPPDGVIGTTAYFTDQDRGGDIVMVELLDGRTHRIHHVQSTFPSTSPAPDALLWLSLDNGSIEQVDQHGRVVIPPHKLPPAVAAEIHTDQPLISSATDDAVVVSAAADPPAGIVAWRPRTGQFRTYQDCPVALAASGRLLLRATTCFPTRGLTLGDPFHSGQPIVVPAPFNYADGAALSPNARYLALGLRTGHAEVVNPTHLGVLDRTTGRWTVIPTDAFITRWSSDGRFLYLNHFGGANGNGGATQVWTFGLPRPVTLRLPSDVQGIFPVTG